MKKRNADNILNDVLVSLRQSHKLTQADIAKKLAISIPAYSKIERGQTDVNLSRLEQIANIFELTVTQLFEEIDPKTFHNTSRRITPENSRL